MKLGRIGILFLLVAALGAYLYWVEVPKARQEATKAKLVDTSADAVTGIDLVYPDREIVLTKRDGGWALTKPLEAPADDTAVKAVLGAITGAEVQKTHRRVSQRPRQLRARHARPHRAPHHRVG